MAIGGTLSHILVISVLLIAHAHSGRNVLLTVPSTSVLAEISGTHAVKLPLGNINGRSCKKFPFVTEFLGVPYAEPVLGEDRFTLPKMYNQQYPINGLDATSFPSSCGSTCGHRGDRIVNGSSEDCLFLNIWTPPHAVPEKSNLPVRVYIHGGAVTECSASDPNIGGCDFAAKTGIIQVNIQFRLGVFGYLAHRKTMEESSTTGNWGLIDQQLALKWIQKHISYFGGDPSRVMINGNSAGGQRVDFQMVLPGSAGLFSSAISQSPPCSHFLSLEQAYRISDDFVHQAGCTSTNPSAELACLRAMPWDTLQELSRNVGIARPTDIVMCEDVIWKAYFHYVVDGTTVPMQVSDAFMTGNYNKVPYLVGVNTADGRDFIEMFYISSNFTITDQTMYEVLDEVYPGCNASRVIESYPKEDFNGKYDPPRARLTKLWTDIFFTCPVVKRLQALKSLGTNSSTTYAYIFNAIPSCTPSDAYYGPTHAAELMYTSGITTGIFPPSGTCDFNNLDTQLSNIMTHAWSSMAGNLEPRWADGTPWVTWNEKDQLLTFLDSNGAHPKSMDLMGRCNIHFSAIRESKSMLRSKGIGGFK